MPRTYTFRLTAEGVEQLQKQLNDLGPQGEAAFQRIAAAAPGMANAVEQAQARASRAQQRLVDETRTQYASLQSSINPYIAAQQRLADARGVVTAAQKLGIASDTDAAQTMAALEQRFAGASNGLSGFGAVLGTARTALGAFGIALGVEQVVSFGNEIFNAAAGLDAQAKQIGVSTLALQAYRAALRDSGIDVGTTDSLIQHFTRTIGVAQAGTGAQREAFVQLGITANDLAGGTEAVLPKVAAALLGIKDASTRAALEAALFGKTGQDLESALTDLLTPTQELIDRETKLGQVMGTDLTAAADKAQREMLQSWQKLEVGLTPIVVSITGLISGLISEVAGLASFPSAVIAAAQAAKGKTADWKIPGTAANGKTPTGVTTDLNLGALGSDALSLSPASSGTVGGAGASGFGGSSPNADAFLAKAKEEAALAGLSASERAAETNAIALANAKLADGNATIKDSNGLLLKQVSSYDQAKTLLTASELAQARSLGIQTQQATAAQKLKTTYDQYIAALGEEARVAGESAAQREDELATVKAAQIVQKQRGVLEQNLVQTYAQAQKILSATQIIEIAREESAKRVAAITQSQTQQLALLDVGLQHDADTRALAVKNAQDELAAGKGLTDEQKAQIENNNRLIQQKQDLEQYSDLIANMKEEAQLAGLSADEREREAAVLKEMHAQHGQLSQDQADEIRQLVAARQEAEKIGQFASNVQDDFANAFAEIGQKGKNAFGDLLSAIKQQFAQLLGWMIAQAIAQPIIVPVVQSLVGTASGIGGLLGGGTGLLGGGSSPLGGIGSIGNLLGGSGNGGMLGGVGSWISGGINSLGASLGFGTTATTALIGNIPTLGADGLITGSANIGGSITSLLPGTSGLLGATSLGSVLGGAFGGMGIGGLAGSLLGENSLGSNIGGAIGGIVGSIIPGIGTLIGSLAGGLLGGLFGNSKPSAHRATANFDGNFDVTGISGTKMTQQSTQAATAAGQAISQVMQALEQEGIDVSNTISKLTISQSRDQSFITTASGQRINVGKPGDVQGAITGTLDYLLGSAGSKDPNVAAVLKHYEQNGGITTDNLQQVLSDIDFAKTVGDLKDANKQLDSVQAGLKSITDSFDAAIQKAKGLGIDTKNLVAQEKEAVQAYKNSFNKSISLALEQITDPVKYQFDQLMAAEKQQLDDAKAIGVDLTNVLALNKALTDQALQQYKDAVVAAKANLAAVEAQGQPVAMTVDQAQSQLEQAYSARASGYNNTIATFTDVAASLRAAVQQLSLSTASSPLTSTSIAQQQFLDAAKAAKGGNASAYSALPGAGEAYLQALSATATSPQEYALAVAKVKTALADAAKQADKQVSTAQKSLDALNKQVKGLISVNDNVVSVKKAIEELKTAEAAQAKAQAAAVAAAEKQLAAAVAQLKEANAIAKGTDTSSSSSTKTSSSGKTSTGSSGKTSTGSGDTTGANDNGGTPLLDKLGIHNIKLPGLNLGIKGLMNGGDFSAGEDLWVGEAGPERVRFGAGGHVFSNAQSAFNDSGIVAALAAMMRQNEKLLGELKTLRENHAAALKIWKSVTQGGDTIRTKAA